MTVCVLWLTSFICDIPTSLNQRLGQELGERRVSTEDKFFSANYFAAVTQNTVTDTIHLPSLMLCILNNVWVFRAAAVSPLPAFCMRSLFSYEPNS